MIHHPLASPMKVSQKGCEFVEEQDGLIKHRCDTQPGSSGSGILLPDYDHPGKHANHRNPHSGRM